MTQPRRPGRGFHNRVCRCARVAASVKFLGPTGLSPGATHQIGSDPALPSGRKTHSCVLSHRLCTHRRQSRPVVPAIWVDSLLFILCGDGMTESFHRGDLLWSRLDYHDEQRSVKTGRERTGAQVGYRTCISVAPLRWNRVAWPDSPNGRKPVTSLPLRSWRTDRIRGRQ